MFKHKYHNCIFSHTSENGYHLSYHRDIEKEITSFYNNILKEPNPNRLQAMEKIITQIIRLVIEDQNTPLMKEITL